MNNEPKLNKLIIFLCAESFSQLISGIVNQIYDFMIDVFRNSPTSFCVVLEQSKDKYVLLNLSYSDDKEFIDNLHNRIDNITTEEFNKRYPYLMRREISNYKKDCDE